MSFNPFAAIGQPLILTLAQLFGVAPQFEIPTEEIIPTSSQDGFSNTQKAALAAILGTAGIATIGAVAVADKFSNTRITISELKREPKGMLDRISEFLESHKKEVSTITALLLLGGIVGIGSQLPTPEPITTTPQEPYQPVQDISQSPYVSGGGTWASE